VGCWTNTTPTDTGANQEPANDVAEVDADADAEVEVEVDAEEGGNIIDTLKERNGVEWEANLDVPALAGDMDDTVQEYVFDVEKSTLNWEAGKIIPGGDHNGTVAIKSGTSTYVNSMLDTATAVLDMTTIVSDSSGLDGHLKNEDFFDVENHPEATIVITSTETVSDEENGDYVMATADLTIKDITNEVTFPIYSEEYYDVANITIDRTLWDIRYGSNKFFDDLKDNAIKDEIEFEVNIVYL